MHFAPNKIYMTAEDETEETIALVAIIEGIAINRLYESIDLNRKAECGFARAAKIFATQYMQTYMEGQSSTPPQSYVTALALQRAMNAVANDGADDSAP